MKADPVRSDSPASRLLEFAIGIDPANLPRHVVEKAKWCLLDTLGCAFFGAGQPWAKIARDEYLEERSHGHGTICGHGTTLAPAAAAMCNGIAIHGFELDDVIAEALIHPGAVVVPAALAAAESTDADVARLLSGIIAGYEVTSRLSMAMGVEPSHRGFHKTGVVGAVAAAVAAGLVLNLDRRQLACAVGLACSTASGIKSFAAGEGGGMVKRMHAGRAAEAGVRVSQLARRGFTAPASALDGRFGLLEVFARDSTDTDYLWHGLGESWAVDEVWTKVYPICGWIQGVVQSLLALREPPPVDERRIRRVVVGTSAFAVKFNGNPSPSDTMEAQYSIPYCTALALTGDPADPREFGPDAIRDPARRAIAQRVELKVDPASDAVYPRHFSSRVELHLENGEIRTAAALDPHGTVHDPCNEAERVVKFMRLADLSPLRFDAAAVVEAVRALETLGSVRAFTRLFRPAGGGKDSH